MAEGYGFTSAWASALNQQVVQNGSVKYLTDFKSHLKLTPAIVSEVADR